MNKKTGNKRLFTTVGIPIPHFELQRYIYMMERQISVVFMELIG